MPQRMALTFARELGNADASLELETRAAAALRPAIKRFGELNNLALTDEDIASAMTHYAREFRHIEHVRERNAARGPGEERELGPRFRLSGFIDLDCNLCGVVRYEGGEDAPRPGISHAFVLGHVGGVIHMARVSVALARARAERDAARRFDHRGLGYAT